MVEKAETVEDKQVPQEEQVVIKKHYSEKGGHFLMGKKKMYAPL